MQADGEERDVGKLEPCPWCSSAAAEVIYTHGACSVCCFVCGAEGPRAKMRDTAIAAWNRGVCSAAESSLRAEVAMLRGLYADVRDYVRASVAWCQTTPGDYPITLPALVALEARLRAAGSGQGEGAA